MKPIKCILTIWMNFAVDWQDSGRYLICVNLYGSGHSESVLVVYVRELISSHGNRRVAKQWKSWWWCNLCSSHYYSFTLYNIYLWISTHQLSPKYTYTKIHTCKNWNANDLNIIVSLISFLGIELPVDVGCW